MRKAFAAAADLTETVTAHWKYTDGDGHDATVDTAQSGVMAFRNTKLGSHAERKRGHQYAEFEELQRICRIPDYRQGRLYWEAPMTYTLSGQWTTASATGPCSGQATDGRILRAEFIRRSLNWHYPTVGFRWELPGPSNPRCQIQASDGDQQVTRTLKDPYQFTYRAGKDLTYTKTALLGKKQITIPVHVHGSENRGDMQAKFDLNGTVVLTRYRACSVSTLAQILHGRHCWDPSYP